MGVAVLGFPVGTGVGLNDGAPVLGTIIIDRGR